VRVFNKVFVIMRANQGVISHQLITNWETGGHALPYCIRVRSVVALLNKAPNVTLRTVEHLLTNYLQKNIVFIIIAPIIALKQLNLASTRSNDENERIFRLKR
jgi:hypothetical protein